MAVLLPLALTACVTGGGTEPKPASLNEGTRGLEGLTWTQIGPDNELVIKTLTAGGGCPEIAVDGVKRTMAPRGEHDQAFPMGVCEAAVTEGDHEAKLGTQSYPIRTGTAQKIVVLGDTGCRIKKTETETVVQDCNDPNHWPFAKIAAAAAAEQPDLVIHLGDYHYREAPCPEGQKGCEGAASGDTWEAWRQDFFEPAKPLLTKAPWIFVRGNHESCKRAGHGWFRYLDPRPWTESCSDQTPPYVAVFGNHILAVVDAADAQNVHPSLLDIPATQDAFLWILTHRPFLTPPPPGWAPELPAELPMHLRGLGKVSAVLAGHRHLLSLNQFRDNRPPELIVGNSGTTLDPVEPGSDKVASSGGPGYQGVAHRDFGYLTMERKGADVWNVVAHDVNGKSVINCQLQGSSGHKTVLNCDASLESH